MMRTIEDHQENGMGGDVAQPLLQLLEGELNKGEKLQEQLKE